MSGEGVDLVVLFTFSISNDKIEDTQLLRPPSLTTIQLLSDDKVLKIFMIRIYRDRVFGVFKVVSSLLEALNDDEHLLVVDLVVEFSRVHLSEQKCYRVKSVIMKLRQNLDYDKIADIRFHKCFDF